MVPPLPAALPACPVWLPGTSTWRCNCAQGCRTRSRTEGCPQGSAAGRHGSHPRLFFWAKAGKFLCDFLEMLCVHMRLFFLQFYFNITSKQHHTSLRHAA